MDTLICDLCGNEHTIHECKLFKDFGKIQESERFADTSMAYQTLPNWLFIQENPRKVFAKKTIEKASKFGPLLAPQSSILNKKQNFPLFIQLPKNVRVWLDQSNESNSNWLSLIPPSPVNYNLVACQIDENIYYISVSQVKPNEQLKVWYAPYYRKRMPNDVMQKVDLYFSMHKKEISVYNENFDTPTKNEIGSSTVITTNSTSDYRDQVLENVYISTSNDTLCIDPLPYSKSTQNQIYSKTVPIISQNGFSTNLFDSTPQMFLVPSLIPNLSYSAVSLDASYSAMPTISLVTKPDPISNHVNQGKLCNLLNAPKDLDQVPEAQVKGIIPKSQLETVPHQWSNCTKESSVDMKIHHHSQPMNVSSNVDLKHLNLSSLRSINVNKYKIVLTHEFSKCEIKNNSMEDSVEGKMKISNQLPCKSIFVKTGIKKENNSLPYKNIPGSSITLNECQNEYTYELISLSLSNNESSKDELVTKILDEVKVEAKSSMSESSCSQNLSCLQCEEKFSEIIKLTHHLKDHLSGCLGKRFKCTLCGSHFKSKSHLEVHGLSHSLKKADKKLSQLPSNCADHMKYENLDNSGWKGSFTCQICHKEFHKAKYLFRHLSKHTGEFFCSVCNKQFARNENLKKHHCTQARMTNHWTCKTCKKTFLSLSSFKLHCKAHGDNVKCKWCFRLFLNEEILSSHASNCSRAPKESSAKKESDAQQSNKYLCHLCGRKFSTSSFLTDHVFFCKQVTEVNEKGRGSCEVCGDSFNTASDLRLHLQKHRYPLLCLNCSQRFRTRGTYEMHICGLRYVCDHCGSSVRCLQELFKHITSHGTPPYYCSLCRYPYYKLENLKGHCCNLEVKVGFEDSRSKKVSCYFCPSLFASEHNLKKHMASLHDVPIKQRFSCAMCGKGFHRSDLLKNHEKIHSAAPYLVECHECHKRFKNGRSLAVHAVLHNRDFRFSCRYCGRGFAQKKDLLRHETAHRVCNKPNSRRKGDARNEDEETIVKRKNEGGNQKLNLQPAVNANRKVDTFSKAVRK